MSKYSHLEVTHNKKSASIILPKVVELFNPTSVIDVGCGTGSFLSVLLDLGIKNIKGIEGNWLDRRKLFVDPSLIAEIDLQKPFEIERKFDLAICLEVAEHLNESSAESFVASLVKLSNVILFSAAIPGQGGQNHVNEQPIAYWQAKFQKHGFLFYDIVRGYFWNNDDVDYWYKQNMFILIKEGENKLGISSTEKINTYVHPELFSLVLQGRENLQKQYNKLRWGNEDVFLYFKLFIKSILLKVKLIK
jgi:SAM-dependent methyltransferase